MLLVTILPQTVTAMVSMVPPMIPKQIAAAFDPSPQVVDLYVSADRMRSPPLVLAGSAALTATAVAPMSLLSPAWSSASISTVVVLLSRTVSGWNGHHLGSLMLTYRGIIAGPVIFGIAAAHTGYPSAYLVMAATIFATGLLIATAQRSPPYDQGRCAGPVLGIKS